MAGPVAARSHWTAARSLSGCVRVGDHVIREVGAIESGHHDGGIAQRELSHDVLAHIRRGRGGQRDGLRHAEALADAPDAPIAGSEVVSPFADAVGLVDGQQGHADVDELAERAAGLHAFGRQIQQLERAVARLRHAVGHVRRAERAVDECRREPATRQRLHLILHQRDERGHDDGESPAHQRRHLDSRATCRRRWAARSARPGRTGRTARHESAAGGSPGNRTARAVWRARRRGSRTAMTMRSPRWRTSWRLPSRIVAMQTAERDINSARGRS